MKVIVNDKNNVHSLQTDLLEVAQILDNLRRYSKVWHEKFGSENRNKMKAWESKADHWIGTHIERTPTSKPGIEK